ncbi:MAG TPA: aminoglycoside phosphotransferase family protein [Acidimicrobiia bacterium]|jgi:hypothetical protein|nr:aminoglycoside phosphotransferase family protein [Acidimicrobiia bacterium]
MPELIGWDDDGVYPFLILEDLSWASWPPPWTTAGIDAVLAATSELAALPAPAWLPSWKETEDEFRKWRVIAEEPSGFAASSLMSPQWLDQALPALVAAEAVLDVCGDAVVHADIRSDDVWLTPLAKLVDWNWTRRGDPELDVAAWLPSLYLEGGPAPWDIRPHSTPSVVAALAGYFCYYANLPPSPYVAPEVRDLQRDQAAVCLDWLAQLGVVPARG